MKEFRNYLVRRGFSTVDTETGSDCFLIHYNDGRNSKVMAASAAELYAKRDELGIELNKVYESVSGYNWAAKLNTTGSGVDVFKVNSYRVDINGPKGLQFVETSYGDDNLQIFLPYNYGKDKIDDSFPAFILNKKLKRIIVAYPYAIGSAIRNCTVYFDQILYDNEENAKDITTIHVMNEDLMIIEDRYPDDQSRWGSFECPTKDLKMVIRLLLRAGWINPDYMNDVYDGVFSMKSLGLEESSSNPYGFEVIDGEIRRFTKYSDDLWIEIPVYHGGFQFIKPKEQFVYEKPSRPFRRPRDENKTKLIADVIIRTNFSDKGISFIGFNLENNYIFTTIEYNIFDVLNGKLPQYEVEDVWPNYNKEAEVVEDEDDEDDITDDITVDDPDNADVKDDDDDNDDEYEDEENISSIVEADTECDKALIEAEKNELRNIAHTRINNETVNNFFKSCGQVTCSYFDVISIDGTYKTKAEIPNAYVVRDKHGRIVVVTKLLIDGKVHYIERFVDHEGQADITEYVEVEEILYSGYVDNCWYKWHQLTQYLENK